MFEITAYRNTSSTNVVNKSIEEIVTLSGTLRDECSILDPVIIVQFDGNDVWRNGFNYIYIPVFNRYYFVTNIVATFGTFNSPTQTNPIQLWELHCHVDVLMSFKDQIKSQKAIVARQEHKYNLMLDDGFFMTYQNPKIQTKTFSVAGPFEKQEFVLIVAGS